MQTNQISSYLTFKIGGELFAAEVSKVLSVLEAQPITKVPLAPSHILGVINLRGSILPIIDAKTKFGMPTEGIESKFIIVIEVEIENEKVQIGVLVDTVHEVIDFDASKILPPPSIGSKYKADFITGVLPLNNQNFAMLLDVNKAFFSDEVIQILDTTQNQELTN